MRIKAILHLLLPLLLLLPPAAWSTDQPDLLLLTKDAGDVDVTGWYMSEKLDGVRAYWNGSELLSRQGNAFAVPEWFTAGFPPFALDGELWTSRGEFEAVASITARDLPHPGWERITYNIFEVPNAPGDLDARLGRLRSWLAEHPAGPIRIIPQIPCRDREHLRAMLAEVEAKGGEGLVVRNPRTPYQTGRSAAALKVKRFDDMEGKVVGYRPGKGKFAGKTGALQVEIEGGLTFYIGSGLKDRERERPPPLGSIVTFKHQGFTNKGIPRFTSFLRVREAAE